MGERTSLLFPNAALVVRPRTTEPSGWYRVLALKLNALLPDDAARWRMRGGDIEIVGSWRTDEEGETACPARDIVADVEGKMLLVVKDDNVGNAGRRGMPGDIAPGIGGTGVFSTDCVDEVTDEVTLLVCEASLAVASGALRVASLWAESIVSGRDSPEGCLCRP